MAMAAAVHPLSIRHGVQQSSGCIGGGVGACAKQASYMMLLLRFPLDDDLGSVDCTDACLYGAEGEACSRQMRWALCCRAFC